MILLIPLVLLFFLSLVPYSLYASGQLHYFLFPFHQVQPEFLSRDWLVTQTANPHPVFGFLIAILHSIGNLPLSLFLLYGVQILLLLIGVFQLSNLFSKDIRSALLTVCLLLFYFSDGLGQSTLYASLVQPTDLAVPFYLFSLVALFQEKILRAWIFLGLSGLIHVHFGIDGALVLLCTWLIQGRHWDPRRMGLGFLLFLLLFSPNLVSILQNFSSWASIQSQETLMFLFNFRGPHHYRPSAFEWSHSVRTLFPVFFLLQAVGGGGNEKTLRRPQIYAATLLCLCMAAAVSTEFFSLPLLAQFYFFRLSPFLLLLGLVFLSRAITSELDQKDGWGIVLSATTLAILFLEKDSRLFIPLSVFLLATWALRRKVVWNELPIIQKSLLTAALLLFPTLLYLGTGRGGELIFDALLGFALVTFLRAPHQSLLAPSPLSSPPLRGRGQGEGDWTALLSTLKIKSDRLISPILLAFLVIGAPALGFHRAFPERISFHPIQITPPNLLAQANPALFETLEWIRTQTAKDALFLVPPQEAGIRFFGERAIVVDFHAHPYGTDEVKEWKERLETVTQTRGLEKWAPQGTAPPSQRELLRKAYLRLTATQAEQIARLYGANYFLTESGYPDKDTLIRRGHRLAFQNSRYLVFQLAP